MPEPAVLDAGSLQCIHIYTMVLTIRDIDAEIKLPVGQNNEAAYHSCSIRTSNSK
jgi:hypothetical protein